MGLKATARSYVRATLRILVGRSAAYEGGGEGLPRWEPANDATFVFRPQRLSGVEACLAVEMHRLPDMRERERFDDALARDTRFRPYLNRLVGSAAGAFRVDSNTLSSALVWSVARSGNSLAWSDDAFERGYATWRDEALARHELVKIITPLNHLEFPGHLDLEENLEITQLDDDEVAACLGVGAITAAFTGSGIAMLRGRAAVRSAIRVERHPFDDGDDVDYEPQAQAEQQKLADDVVEALRVFKPGLVVGGVHVAVGPGGRVRYDLVRPPHLTGPRLSLDDEEAAAFKAFWPRMKRARSHRALDAVIRRFGYAGERRRADDEIVDLVAALEALLLAELKDRRELSYRTRLRGAVFIDVDGVTRGQVQRQLRRAYNVRSAVAHGGAPDAEDLKGPDNNSVTLTDFVDGIEELVRLALKNAIDGVAAGAGWPPDWDTLILEQGAYPKAS